MALPRPDVKFYLDFDDHAALKVLADHDGVKLNEMVESVMHEYISKRVHDASVLAVELERAGVLPKPSEGDGETQNAVGIGRK